MRSISRWATLALALVALVALAVLGDPAPAAASAPIPFGTALWYACTEPAFDGPSQLDCPEAYNPLYLQTFLHEFQRFTPENEFKMVYLEPEQNHFDFGLADQIAAFARENHKTIRGHTLLWGEENPWWLTDPLLPWSRQSLGNVMDSYISTVVGHFAKLYPGVVGEWDVVNEPITTLGTFALNPWERAIGSGYIRLALAEAHAADPSATLLINQIGAETPGPQQQALLALATQLKQEGAPLDAIGFESHVTPDTAPTLQELVSLWRSYAAIGLHVEVTELDVGDDYGVDDPAAKAAVFERFAQACRLAGNCTGLTVWGVADQYSWLGPGSDALLFGDDFQPSPAVRFVDQMLAGRPLATAGHRRKRERPASTRSVSGGGRRPRPASP
jgi:endo-1,4-beta-xylanase